MQLDINMDRYHESLQNFSSISVTGKVIKIVGLVTEAEGPVSSVGAICDICRKGSSSRVTAEVLGFRDNRMLLMPLSDIHGIGPGSRVIAREQKAFVGVGDALLGRVIDGLGNPLDGKGPLLVPERYPIYASPPNPLTRKRICESLDLGVRAINGLLTVGCGQRIGIFSGSGVGKSVLLGMIARYTNAEVNVIALIGERGREVNEFISKQLGEEGLKRSVVVVATSDNLPLIRMRGAFVATAIAEYFRNKGKRVILMMDSVTRFAMAQREIGLATGEPPTTKGYTPSVFAILPRLLERTGTCDHQGTITGLYTVLVDGDDMNEPIADAVRGILDGHIILSRDLAAHGHYPSIDILNSVSRVMADICKGPHREKAMKLKSILATYKKAEDMINIGAYVKGSNPQIDQAIGNIEKINHYLRQGMEESVSLEQSLKQLQTLV